MTHTQLEILRAELKKSIDALVRAIEPDSPVGLGEIAALGDDIASIARELRHAYKERNARLDTGRAVLGDPLHGVHLGLAPSFQASGSGGKEAYNDPSQQMGMASKLPPKA
jgi:hypothetical protein